MAARPAGAAFPWSSYRINFRRLGRQAVYVTREPETACEELGRRFQRGLGKHLIAAAEQAAATEFGARAIEMTVVRQRTELID